MNGISVNTSENVADSQTRQRVGSESAWDTGEIKCDLCEFGTKNKFGLKIPFLKKHSTAKFKCLTCDFTSMSHSELVEHNDRLLWQDNTNQGSWKANLWRISAIRWRRIYSP